MFFFYQSSTRGRDFNYLEMSGLRAKWTTYGTFDLGHVEVMLGHPVHLFFFSFFEIFENVISRYWLISIKISLQNFCYGNDLRH